VNTAIAWINQNKQISIPVFTIGGIIIVLILAQCSWWLRRYHRRRRQTKAKDSRPPSIVSNPPENGDPPPGYAGFRSSHVSRLEAGSTRSSQNVGIETPLPAYGRNRLSAAGAEEWEMLPTNTGHHSRSSSVAPVPSLQNQDEASTQSSISTNLRISNPHSLKTFPVSRRMTTVSIASADSDTYLPPKHQVVNIAESQDSTV
jgi:hypothetical protein